jgi:hypothetical protein
MKARRGRKDDCSPAFSDWADEQAIALIIEFFCHLVASSHSIFTAPRTREVFGWTPAFANGGSPPCNKFVLLLNFGVNSFFKLRPNPLMRLAQKTLDRNFSERKCSRSPRKKNRAPMESGEAAAYLVG